MKKRVLGAMIAVIALTGCKDDDDNGDGSRGKPTAPQATHVIPGTFKNTKDEAGFRSSLSGTKDVLKSSTEPFALRGSHAGRESRRAAFGAMLLDAGWRKLGLPAHAEAGLLKSPSARLLAAAPGGSSMDESDELFEDVMRFQTGDDCSQLLFQLTDSYDQAVQQYSEAVTQIAAIDFSQAKGFTRATPVGDQEAFAYDVRLTAADLAASGGSAGSQLEGVDFNLTGRFSGGANEQAVALKAAGQVDLAAQGDSGSIDTNLNTYADLAAKRLQLGFGLGALVNAHDQASGESLSVTGTLALEATLQGGARPEQAFKLSGEATDGHETHSLTLAIALAKPTATQMTLKLGGNFDGEMLNRTVAMSLIEDDFGYPTCRVDRVSN